MSRFALAPMSGLIRGLTVLLLALPVVFVVAGAAGTGTLAHALNAPAALLVALYAAVWLFFRPSAFEVGPEGLVLRFPLRRVRILRRDVAAARVIDRAAFRARYGLATRVGVGGLWGGFGWLWTRRRGFIDLYVSRTDGLVLVERRSGRDLLVTPEHPETFVSGLAAGNPRARVDPSRVQR